MSRLRIKHRTVYRYAEAVQFGRHRLVLRPREGHDLRVLSMSLQIEPAHQLTWTRDVFGNSVALVDFTAAASQLKFDNEVIVERWAPFPIRDSATAWPTALPITYDALELMVAGGYQQQTFPDDCSAVREWLDQVLPHHAAADAAHTILTLCKAIKTEIHYLRRSEKGVQTPAYTLHYKKGSCRDQATLMLEAVRALGIAGRFVSGYLHCAASDAGRASTHAWMEAYLPHLGWCGFDPTLGEASSQKHIAIGVSNHPRGVMPISGLFTGKGSDFLDMTVQVTTEALA